jgi:hypothetical protein
MFLLVALLLALTTPPTAAAERLVGRAHAIDGDGVAVAGIATIGDCPRGHVPARPSPRDLIADVLAAAPGQVVLIATGPVINLIQAFAEVQQRHGWPAAFVPPALDEPGADDALGPLSGPGLTAPGARGRLATWIVLDPVPGDPRARRIDAGFG